LKEEIPKYSYLTSLTETLIFTTYQAVLLADTEAPFPSDFTQESRDTYYRLKFRALSSALSSSVVAAKAARAHDAKAATESLVGLSLGVTQLCFRAVAKEWAAVEKMSDRLNEMITQARTRGNVEETKFDGVLDIA
jgi:hypothetical protein